jgi:ketosteroid isomerase-like protein
MSEENVAIVRGIFETASGSKEAMLAALPEAIPGLCHPDVEFIETPERVDARTYRGHEGVRRAFERWLEQWDEYSAELRDVEDHGDQVFATVRESAEGIGSGAIVEKTLYMVFTFRDGKLARYVEAYDEATARADVAH